MNRDFYYLGTLTRPFGLKGELCAFFDTDNPEHYVNLDAVFIETENDYIPYLIEKLRYCGNNQFILKFQNVDLNSAKLLIHSDLYLPMSDLPKLTGNRFYFHEVIGFQVIDEEKGDIGICHDFIELSNNPIMQVMKNRKEILIPVNQQFIRKVDRTNKILYILAPEGLIDLYLPQ